MEKGSPTLTSSGLFISVAYNFYYYSNCVVVCAYQIRVAENITHL